MMQQVFGSNGQFIAAHANVTGDPNGSMINTNRTGQAGGANPIHPQVKRDSLFKPLFRSFRQYVKQKMGAESSEKLTEITVSSIKTQISHSM